MKLTVQQLTAQCRINQILISYSTYQTDDINLVYKKKINPE